jgi:uncharacterized phage protein (TIGR02218 family)
MKPASPALVALLGSSTEFIMADLWTLTLQSPAPAQAGGGTQYLYSGGQTAITDQATGRVFALGPRFERSMVKVVIGIQSDELDVRIYPATTDILGGTSWEQAVWQGQFDGAVLQLERAFMGAGGWGDTSPGTVVLFAGRISDLEASRTMISLKVRSHLELLNIEMPRRLWQPQCNHNFGDAMCGYDRVNGKNAEGTSTGIGQLTFAAAAGSTSTLILGSPASGQYYLGTIIGLTGANAGQKRTITGVAVNQISVKLAFLSAPAAGDQFQVLPGCDRTLLTCANVYRNSRVTSLGYNPANAERFGGFPFVPPPEDAV